MTFILILGRQPALGVAELESGFGSDCLQKIQADIIELQITDTDEAVNFNHFGGIIKATQVIDSIDSTNWEKINQYLIKKFPTSIISSEGKLKFGLSSYGLDVKPQKITGTALSFKKMLRNLGYSSRAVPNTEPALNSAQVLHNNLTGSNGLEINFIKNRDQTIITKTVWIQDINAYRRRDQERPMRDARVGMLPPKLAQIIINLATGPGAQDQDLVSDHIAKSKEKFNEISVHGRLLDPFCGTGVLLQEALLQGYDVLGTDIDDRMIEYSKKNLQWLGKNLSQIDNDKVSAGDKTIHDSNLSNNIYTADATSHKWMEKFDVIACETYLGRPFAAQPDPETLKTVIHDVNTIHKKFLKNVASQTKPGFRLCIAVPAWHTKNGIKHLPVLDQLSDLAYNRVSFVHANNGNLIYHREGQVVGRELVVLIRK